MRLLVIAISFLLGVSFQTQAANTFFYVGASAQQQEVKLPTFTTGIDIEKYVNNDYQTFSEGTPFRIYGGYQYNELIAFELGYTDYLTRGFTLKSNDLQGRVDLRGTSESMSLDLKTLVTVPLNNRLTANANIGMAMWSNDIQRLGGQAQAPALVDQSDNGVSLLFGAGISYAINKNIALVLDFEKRSINSSSVGSVGIGVAFSL